MSKNEFYGSHDTERLDRPLNEDYRTAFQRDRDAIVHSAAFRRLQGKTQVFLSGEYDFYRTRLTHSIEVAQIGRSICYFLRHSSDALHDKFFIDPDLVEAACLAHDIGHPPYGHAGERTLHELMRDKGGFEGNAQSLRILCHTNFPSGKERTGMNPCRALLDAILKYRTCYGELERPDNHFVYDSQRSIVDWIHPPEHRQTVQAGKLRDALKPIECQIMDWADDTAYSINDLSDGIEAGFVTIERIERWLKDHADFSDCQDAADGLCEAIRGQRVKAHLGRRIADFVHATTLEERPEPASIPGNRHRFALCIDPAIQRQCSFYKSIAVDLIFRSPAIHNLEHKGRVLLEGLFRTYEENYFHNPKPLILLPGDYHGRISEMETELDRYRILCDYLSGMTDHFATRTYRRLHDPEGGSIAELI